MITLVVQKVPLEAPSNFPPEERISPEVLPGISHERILERISEEVCDRMLGRTLHF